MEHPDEDNYSEEEGENDVFDNQDQNQHFYKEYCRLYYANIILTNRLQQLLDEKQDLGYKLNRLEVSTVPYFLLYLDKLNSLMTN